MSFVVFVDGLHSLVADILPSKQFLQFLADGREPAIDNGIDFSDGVLIFTF